ncbi:MAG: hypothetical protein ACFFBD_11875, partial [Candidatus Hodarchaeota archaeon]
TGYGFLGVIPLIRGGPMARKAPRRRIMSPAPDLGAFPGLTRVAICGYSADSAITHRGVVP